MFRAGTSFAIVLAGLVAGPLAAQTKIQPFFAEQILSDHRQSVQSTRILARRSDGARSVLQSIVQGKSEYPRESAAYSRELLLPNGVALRLVDALRVKSTWPPVPEAEMAGVLGLSETSADCGIAASGARPIGRDIVEGLEALVSQSAAVDGRRTMQWLVPALGCAVLKSAIQETPPNGPPTLVFETRLARITLGEPDEKLFYLGPEYAEMKPSRVLELQQSALHVEVLDRGGFNLDQKYKRR